MKWADSLAKLNSYDAIVAQEILSHQKCPHCTYVDVLIVMDSRLDYQLVCRGLDRLHDFDVMPTRARTVQQAERFLREECFDLILLDGALPDGDRDAILALIDALALPSPAALLVDDSRESSEFELRCKTVRKDGADWRLEELLASILNDQVNTKPDNSH